MILDGLNVEKYIEKCLKSLVDQTLNEIEIILVNDGSQDDSEKIAKQFQEKYSNKIKYYEKPNGGLGDARNFGINYATGEYIAFLDSDDYVESTMYEEMYEKAKQENEKWKQALEMVYSLSGLQPQMKTSCYFYMQQEMYCINEVIRCRREMFGMTKKKLRMM